MRNCQETLPSVDARSLQSFKEGLEKFLKDCSTESYCTGNLHQFQEIPATTKIYEGNRCIIREITPVFALFLIFCRTLLQVMAED